MYNKKVDRSSRIERNMQKKIIGFLIATVLFNAVILSTVYLTELFSREVSVIWSWLVFLIIVLGGAALLSNITNRLKLGYRAGVFAFFWSDISFFGLNFCLAPKSKEIIKVYYKTQKFLTLE